VREAVDEDLLVLVVIVGELETRFRDRGCSGDCGVELDRRSVLRAEAFTRSFDDSFFLNPTGVLIASVRDLRVALITSVANIDLSFGDKPSS